MTTRKKKIKRTVRIVPTIGHVGQRVSVPIEIKAPDDVATSFQLEFPPHLLSNPEVKLSETMVAAGVALTVNIRNEMNGKLIIVMDDDQVMVDGVAVIVTFDALKIGSAELSFSDYSPSQGKRSMSDATANSIEAVYKSGTVRIRK